MKAMLSAFAIMALIAIGASFVLQEAGFSTDQRQASDAVRLDP